jgi:flagellin-like hook-associated protein FlgL
MIRGIDAQTQRFLIDVGRTQRKVARANDQINSGYKLAKPSDAPDKMSSLFRVQTGLHQLDQSLRLLAEQRAELETAEQVMQQGVKLMDKAVTLATQGATDTTNAEMRRTIADQVANLHEQMVALSRTVVSNRFIFSGDRENVPLYPEISRAGDPVLPVTDLQGNPLPTPGTPWSYTANNLPVFTSPSPINGYTGTEEVDNLLAVNANREITHPAGYTFRVAISGVEIFDERNPSNPAEPSNNNVFYALNRLRFALETPIENFATREDYQQYVRDSLALVKQSADHLSRKAGFYGGAMSRVLDGIDYANKLTLQLRAELKEVRDADMVEAITELQQGQLHIETAFKARSANSKRSLFDYIG